MDIQYWLVSHLLHLPDTAQTLKQGTKRCRENFPILLDRSQGVLEPSFRGFYYHRQQGRTQREVQGGSRPPPFAVNLKIFGTFPKKDVKLANLRGKLWKIFPGPLLSNFLDAQLDSVYTTLHLITQCNCTGSEELPEWGHAWEFNSDVHRLAWRARLLADTVTLYPDRPFRSHVNFPVIQNRR